MYTLVLFNNFYTFLNKFDLSRLDPVAIDMVKAFSTDHASLIVIPYAIGIAALYYNKDIFDHFGVNYPKDGMTWDQIAQLAKHVSREDGGTTYYGLGFSGQSYSYIGSQLSLTYVDDKTNKAAINTEQWKKVLNLSKTLFDIPGNSNLNSFKGGSNTFAVNKNLAMLVATNEIRKFTKVNWDMVTMPTLPEAPGTTDN